MSIPRMVIVAYRPKPGKDEVLLSEVRDHVHLLRSEGLATDRPATVMRAKDGTLVEMFEWASPAAIEEAHANPRVQAMWARFAACCDYVPLNSLPEAGGMFAEFETVHIQSPPIVQPDPDKRAE
jgi:quinol monooxygenase YgiN